MKKQIKIKQNNMLPEGYLNWSMYSLFRSSPEAWYKRYILKEEGFKNKYMEFGGKMALLREGKEKTEDEIIRSVLIFLPQYPNREYELTAPIKIAKKPVILLGTVDGVDFRRHIVADDKTGLKGNWTQKIVDNAKQLTWYSMIYLLMKGRLPNLELNWIETEVVNSKVVATGNIKTFTTTRTLKDIVLLRSDVNKVWIEMQKMCDNKWKEVL